MKYLFSTFALIPTLALMNSAVHASDDEAGTSRLSFTTRVQAELVNAEGRAAERREQNGWHLTDAWGGGQPNSHNWNAVFADAAHELSSGIEIFGRYGLNFNTDGIPNGPSKEREVYLGVRGQWGQVRAGRLETPYKLNTLSWDPFNATFLQARANLGKSGGALGHGGYWNDSLDYTYTTDRFTFRSFFSKSNGLSSALSQDNSFSASLNVRLTEELEVAIAHVDAGNAGQGPRRGSKLGVRYRMNSWTLTSEYETRDRGIENADIVFATVSYQAAKIRYSASAGGFFDDSVLENDGQYIAFGLDTPINAQLRFHTGVRYNSRDTLGGETLIGIGFRYLFNAERRF